jgi:hypothetical protein
LTGRYTVDGHTLALWGDHRHFIPKENVMRTCLRGTVLMAAVLVAGIARSDETKVPLSSLPSGGLEAVKHVFPGAEIAGAAKETEDGKTLYEVTLKLKGKTIDLTLGEDGKIQLVEKEIPYNELPAAVKKTLEAKYPKATYKIVEEVSNWKDGKAVLDFFETLLATESKSMIEVQLSPDGRIKSEEKKQPGGE